MSDLETTQKVDECLDLSSKNIFVLVFFTVSDPGHEYEIFAKKDVECYSWCCLKKGDSVRVKYGTARSEGTVITVSDNLKSLKRNFNKLVRMHQDTLRDEKARAISRNYILQSRHDIGTMNDIATNYQTKKNGYILEKSHIKSEQDASTTSEKETQTDCRSTTLDPDFIDLEKKYEEIKTKYHRIYSLVLDLQRNMVDSLRKVRHFKLGANGDTAYYTGDEEDKENIDNFSKMIQIGSNGTKIPKQVYDSVNWLSYTTATRKLLVTLFPRKMLATHSLTGKPSPAFLTSDKEAKARLDPDIISDIVQVVSKKSRVTESLVRSAITTKCADENKLYKKRLQKGSEEEDENVASTKRKRVS